MPLAIRRATSDDLEVVAALFDQYRQFYRAATDLDAARRFLRERLATGDSVVQLAFNGAEALGFTQLYPSFSSLSMARILILNDLFVAPAGRRCGAGAALLDAAAAYARESGAVRLTLSTGIDNTTAQSLYEQKGWKRDTDFFVYTFQL
jgi:GNAT superfamily N-acetyltransferase